MQICDDLEITRELENKKFEFFINSPELNEEDLRQIAFSLFKLRVNTFEAIQDVLKTRGFWMYEIYVEKGGEKDIEIKIEFISSRIQNLHEKHIKPVLDMELMLIERRREVSNNDY